MKLELATTLVNSALAIANEQALEISVAVVDVAGGLVSFSRTDGVSPQACILAQTKAYTSARDRQTSGSLGQWAKETGKDMGYWNDPKITGIAGGVPVIENSTIIGAIGISGLSEQDDENLALQAIGRCL